MNRVFLVSVLLSASVSSVAFACSATQTTLVFGNGIGTSHKAAQDELDKILVPEVLAALDPSIDQSCVVPWLVYDSNFVDSNNVLVNVATYLAQLADALAQLGIDYAANFWQYWNGVLQPPATFQNIQRTLITSATSVFQPDLVAHEAFYNSELGLGHNVIVIAHSQGNLYVNQAYDVVTTLGGQNLFHIVAVASPAHSVADPSGQHFTLYADVIATVPGSLAANIANDAPSPCLLPWGFISCHDFANSYMDDQNDPKGDLSDRTRPAIVDAVITHLTQSAQMLQWTQLLPGASPPARQYASMAFDETRGVSVLFGGISSSGGSSLTDTWTWDGQTWSQMHPTHIPNACSGAMAYDRAQALTVLFQVCSGSGETWTWNGSDWARLSPVHSPTTVSPNGMAYDAATQSVVLFGGSNTSVPYGNETWNWDGSDWTHLNPVTVPPGRQAHAMAYDEVHQQVVMFGGISSSPNIYPNDTWVWNGSNWSQQNPSVNPQPAYGHTMDFDVQHGVVVLVESGNLTFPTSSVWTWNGSDWSLTMAANPFVPFGQAMAYDRSHSETVLLATTGQQPVSQTWILK